MKPRDIIPGWNYLEYLLLRATAALVNALPITWSTKIARFIGDIIFWLFTGRRKVASKNVDLAFKETKSKAEKLAKELIKQGKVSETEGRKLAQQIVKETRKQSARVQKVVDKELKKALKKRR